MIESTTDLIDALTDATSETASDTFGVYTDDGKAFEVEVVESQGDGAPIAIRIRPAQW